MTAQLASRSSLDLFRGVTQAILNRVVARSPPAEARKALARLLTLMADDAVFLDPGQAPFGPDGFSSTFSDAHQTALISCSSELEEVVVVGKVA